MNLLHLSDLHIEKIDQATLWSNQLAEDLRELNCPRIDCLVISGDVGNVSNRDEYKAAATFIQKLTSEFRVENNRIVLVPGNHDLSWSISKSSYERVLRKSYTGPVDALVKVSSRTTFKKDESKYKKRFEEFSRFYKTVQGIAYPSAYERQYVLKYFPEVNLLILGLNSAWHIDHIFKARASIHPLALSNALSEIRQTANYASATKIAVWHHPIASEGEDRIKDLGPLEQLAKAGFRFVLHGHIHKAESQLFKYDRSVEGRQIDLIAAGTFGAPTRELIPTYPWQYNLIRFAPHELRVETRRRHSENGPWKPDAIWVEKEGKDPKPFYTIKFKPHRRNATDWEDAPEIREFYGRERELARFESWINRERCKLIGISGIGGIGKSVFARKLASKVRKGFDFTIWRSLVNAPPLEHVLDNVLRFISEQQLTSLPSHLEEKFSLLTEYLIRHRCLIVLDNFETIFQAGQPVGRYRSGYEGYGRLLDHLGKTCHKSCVIVTTRELPPEIARLETVTREVRSDELLGVPRRIAQQILASFHLHGNRSEWEILVEKFSGNPQFLRIVAGYINKSEFSSHISKFLQAQHKPDEPRSLYNEQFARLPPIEQTVLFWLAIVREPIGKEELAMLNYGRISLASLSVALASLRSRSLIESRGDKYGLQNVITEYTTDRFCEQVAESIISCNVTFLDMHPLLMAQARDDVRNSQHTLILKPIAETLHEKAGNRQAVEALLRATLQTLKENPKKWEGYAVSNIIHLLWYFETALEGLDFASLPIRQAYLREVSLQGTNFAGCKFWRCSFLDTFSGILNLAVSTKGNMLASGDASGDLRIWNTATWELLRSVAAHSDWVRAVRFSHASDIVFSCSDDRTIKAWDVSTGQCIKEYMGHAGRIRAIDINPPDRHLVSGGDEGEIRWWDIASGRCFRVSTAHSAHLRALAFSKDGLTLATGGEDNKIKVWDVLQAVPTKTLEGHEGYVCSVALSNSGKYLLSGSEDGTARLWHLDSGRTLYILHGHERFIWTVAFSPDDATLATGSGDHTVKLWSFEDGRCLATLSGHTNWIRTIAYSPDGKALYTGGDDRTIRIWDVATETCTKTLVGYTEWIYSVSFSRDGRMLAFANEDRTVAIWALHEPSSRRILRGHTDWIWSIGFSPDGELIASGSGDRTIRLWEVKTSACLRTLVGHTGQVRCVTFNPDGKHVASGSDDCRIKMWNSNNGKCLFTLDGHRSQVWALAFNADGTILASGSDDGDLKLWNTVTKELTQTLSGHAGRVISIAFSPDGRLIATGSEDHTVKVWDVTTFDQVHDLTGHESFVQCVAFSNDGNILASGASEDLRIWDVATGVCQKTLPVPTDRQRAIVAIEAGTFLAGSSTRGTLRVLNIETEEKLGELKANRPYEGMVISESEGLTPSERQNLIELGAID
jgi:WD40 repeat protein/3',5'-cyclic AMP phosphodiesterase CpdA